MTEPRIGSLCTGYGGLDLAAQAVFGGELSWWSDIDPGPIKVMRHHHPETPNLGDLKTVSWRTVPEIDILTAGYPCQPFSNAGKRLGTEDPRHIWPWIADALGVLRPRIVLLENVAAHLRKGFDVVSADLAGLGYRVAWGLVSASEAGAPHGRKRLYVVASDVSRELDQRGGALGSSWRTEHPNGGLVAADAPGVGRGEGRTESAGERRGPDAPDGRRDPASDPSSPGLEVGFRGDRDQLPAATRSDSSVAHAHGVFLREQPWWGRGPDGPGSAFPGLIGTPGIPDAGRWRKYADAVARWERLIGVPAPEATVYNPRAKTKRSLSPFLTEWMMGVPGRITSVSGLNRNEQIKLAGNGVVPQQAELAIRELYRRLKENE